MNLSEKELKKCLIGNKDKVLNAITNAYPNPIIRSELVVLTGLSDRAVRENISRLRHKDVWIISNSNRSGYWLTKIPTLWDRFVENWNLSNRYNMLKKSNYSEMQTMFEENQTQYEVCFGGRAGGGK